MAKSIMEIAMENITSMVENPTETLLETVKDSIKEPLAPELPKGEVGDAYTSMILETSFGVKTTPKTKPKVVETKKTNSNPKLENLVTEFFNVVSRAKYLIQEMTTCGMIGTKTTGFSNKKKKVKK